MDKLEVEQWVKVHCYHALFELPQTEAEIKKLFTEEQLKDIKMYLLPIYEVQNDQLVDNRNVLDLKDAAKITIEKSQMLLQFLEYMEANVQELFTFRDRGIEKVRAIPDLVSVVPFPCVPYRYQIYSITDLMSNISTWPHSISCRCRLEAVE